MRLTISVLVVGLLLCLYGSPARADQADDAVRFFCGAGHADLAPLIRAEARRHTLRPAYLALVMAAESSCRTDAVNVTTGATGLFGILPGRSADPDHLERDELLDPATNARLGARHLARLLSICGAFGPALHLYHSRDGKCRNWRTDSHVARLLTWERAFWRWLRGGEARRS